MKKHRIETPVKPHTTIRSLVVHPKDKIVDNQKCGIVYRVPCLNCPQKYTGESGRKLCTRIEEHHKEAQKVNTKTKTRSTSLSEDTTTFKSAISEHTREANHLMNWDEISIIDRESNKKRRWIKEAIHVRSLKPGESMNRDEGGYELSHVWDPLLCRPPTPPGRPRRSFPS